MAHHVSLDEAQLTNLIDAAVSGEIVLIVEDSDEAIQLGPVATVQHARPQFGSGKGLMIMAKDFDAPLAEFDEYLQ